MQGCKVHMSADEGMEGAMRRLMAAGLTMLLLVR